MGVTMLQAYAVKLAEQSGIQLSSVSVIEGRKVGCSDAHLLHLIADGNLVSALVYRSELEELQSRSYCEQLEIKIKTALSRLQVLRWSGFVRQPEGCNKQ
jgi:hypothetical protein